MFLSLHDAKMRLENTLVRHKREPIFIHTVEQPRVGYYLNIEYLRTRRDARISLKDKALDLSPVPLGNMNHEGNVYYASRAPQRIWKQGLSRDSFFCKSLTQGFIGIPINCVAIVKTINNDYPSIHRAWGMIEEGTMVAAAFSRHYSLIANKALVFNSKSLIGHMNEDLLGFELDKTYLYLKEHLQASTIGK